MSYLQVRCFCIVLLTGLQSKQVVLEEVHLSVSPSSIFHLSSSIFDVQGSLGYHRQSGVEMSPATKQKKTANDFGSKSATSEEV